MSDDTVRAAMLASIRALQQQFPNAGVILTLVHTDEDGQSARTVSSMPQTATVRVLTGSAEALSDAPVQMVRVH